MKGFAVALCGAGLANGLKKRPKGSKPGSSGMMARMIGPRSGDCFQCLDGSRCVNKAWRCDGDNDCSDSSDEQNCVYDNVCRETGQLACETADGSWRCLPTSWLCDDYDDCHKRDGNDFAFDDDPAICAAYEEDHMSWPGWDAQWTTWGDCVAKVDGECGTAAGEQARTRFEVNPWTQKQDCDIECGPQYEHTENVKVSMDTPFQEAYAEKGSQSYNTMLNNVKNMVDYARANSVSTNFVGDVDWASTTFTRGSTIANFDVNTDDVDSVNTFIKEEANQLMIEYAVANSLPAPKIYSETVTLDEITQILNVPDLPGWEYIFQTLSGVSHVWSFSHAGLQVKIHSNDIYNGITEVDDKIHRRGWFIMNDFYSVEDEVQGSGAEFFVKRIPIEELEKETTAEAMVFKYRFVMPEYDQQMFGIDKYYKAHTKHELIFSVSISLTATTSTEDNVQISEEVSMSSSGRSMMINPTYTLEVQTTDHNIEDGLVEFKIRPSMPEFLFFRAKSCYVECTEGNCAGEKAYIYGYPNQPYCQAEFVRFQIDLDDDNEYNAYAFKPFKWSSNRGVTYDEKQSIHCEIEHAMEPEDLPTRTLSMCDEDTGS